MREQPVPPRVRAYRAAQALAGIVVASLGVGFYDWRAGVIALGAGLLLTSAVWRATA